MSHLITGHSIRTIGVATVFAGSFVLPVYPAIWPPVTWVALPVAIMVSAVVVLLLFLFRRWLRHNGTRLWTRPSWRKNPLSWVDPIQFFHFIAFLSIAQGIGASLRTLLVSGIPLADSVLPLAIGLGILIGVHLTVVVMPNSFSSDAGATGR